MLKAGKFTAALLVITVGALLLIDQILGRSFTVYLLEWWPVFIIALGVEYILVNIIARNGERRVRLDLGSIIVSVLVSVVILGVTQVSNFNFGNWSFGGFHLTDENAYKYELSEYSKELTSNTKKIYIENPNGDVSVQSGNVEQVQVHATLRVSNKLDRDKADKIAKASYVDIIDGSTMEIVTKGEEYRFWIMKQVPRMDVTITVPETNPVDYEVKLINGKISLQSIDAKDHVDLETINGTIRVSNIVGHLDAKTINGQIQIDSVKGNLDVSTVNGVVNVSSIEGEVSVETTNGNVKAINIQNDGKFNTTNGKVTVENINGKLIIDTTNGGIRIASEINGDWNLDSTVGGIDISLPRDSHFEIKGKSNGSLNTDFPISRNDRRISGKVGEGTYTIKIDTNSSVNVYEDH